MKKFVLLTLSLGVVVSNPFGNFHSDAFAASRKVKCPVVVDRESGEYSSSSAKYVCYSRSSDARRNGYSRHDFSDDSSHCSSQATPTPGPSPTPGGVGTGDYNYTGPGQKDSAVFLAASGGSVTYNFPGGGQFELKVMRASTDKRVESLLEITQAGSGTVPFSAQSFPIFIKIEGPGAWEVAVDVN